MEKRRKGTGVDGRARKKGKKGSGRPIEKARLQVVVNTNIIFSFFKKDSVTKKLFLSNTFALSSPTYALQEIEKYQETIMKKSNITRTEFMNILVALQHKVSFISTEDYKQSLAIASPDKDDIDFLALANVKKCVLWSNDKKLKKHKEVKVLNTAEILKLLKISW